MNAPAVAVIGVGHMGELHARKLAQLEREGLVRLAGVCDLDPERARDVAASLDTKVLADVEDVARSADAACVAVPTLAHVEVSEHLLRAGLDLLLEKPIATSREQARRLIDTAAQEKRLLQVGHIERFGRALREIQPVISRPRFIEVHRLGPYSGRATDVGVVLDLMIHDLDIVAMLAGSAVASVEAIGVPVLSATEDIANARLRFENGCVANMTASRVSAERLRKIRLFQSDAYISIDFGSNAITVMRREGDPGGERKITAEKLEFDEADALLAQDRAFVESVRTRSAPEVSGEQGYRALDLALRIQESLPSLEEIR